VAFLGGTIKSVEGPGERSAFGLPDETGVIVVAAGTMARSGLKDGDVIIKADGKPVRTTADLQKAYDMRKSKAKIILQVIRNQQAMSIGLTF
jgi:S1-C subfamily serine protease